MKKITIKAAALMLTLALASSLAACSNSGDGATTAAPAKQASTETGSAEETAAAPQELPAETKATETQVTETKASAVEIDYRDIDVQALISSGANIVHTDIYGIYNLEGDAVDSAIKADVYYDLDKDTVVRIDFEEALIPYSLGGAEGWGLLDEETAAALGEATVTLESGVYPMYFELAGITWTGAESDGGVTYTAQINGESQDFINYITTKEGGAWYHDHISEGASLLDADGQTVSTVQIGTKASIGHGVDFWMSPITFPGNIELIKNYIYDYGVSYDYAPAGNDIVKNDDGQWVVADVVTGATLAGAPNYFNLVKAACEQIAAGDYNAAE